VYEIAKGPREVGEVLRSSLALFQAAFLPMLPLSLIAALAAVIYRAFIVPAVPEDVLTALKFDFVDARFLTLLAVAMVLNLFAYGAMWAQGDFIAHGERMSTPRALAIGLRALPTLVGASVLFIAAVAAGSMLFLVPGVFLSVTLFLYGPAVILERKGVFAALGESHRLVLGHWWHTAVLQTLGFGATMLVAILVQWTADLLLAGASPDASAGLVAAACVAAIVAVATNAFVAVLMLEIYRDLKLRRDARPA
jgi:hypothetical protein